MMFSCMLVMSFDHTPGPIILSCLPFMLVDFFLPLFVVLWSQRVSFRSQEHDHVPSSYTTEENVSPLSATIVYRSSGSGGAPRVPLPTPTLQ